MPKLILKMNKFELSKTDALTWINHTLETKYSKIEQLGDCIAYIQIIHAYTENLVHLNLVKCFFKSQNPNKKFDRVQFTIAKTVRPQTN